MKHKSVYIYAARNHVISSGVSFAEFFCAFLQGSSKQILMLDGAVSCARFDKKTGFSLVRADETAEILDQIYDFGDFKWLDFDGELSNLTPAQLAKILYMRHFWDGQAFYKGLKNEFFYLSHDDYWYVKVFMKRTSKYKSVISNLIQNSFTRRKISPAPPKDIVDKIYETAGIGAMFDFENMSSCELKIYQIPNQNLARPQDFYEPKRGAKFCVLRYDRRRKTYDLSDFLN